MVLSNWWSNNEHCWCKKRARNIECNKMGRVVFKRNLNLACYKMVQSHCVITGLKFYNNSPKKFPSWFEYIRLVWIFNGVDKMFEKKQIYISLRTVCFNIFLITKFMKDTIGIFIVFKALNETFTWTVSRTWHYLYYW